MEWWALYFLIGISVWWIWFRESNQVVHGYWFIIGWPFLIPCELLARKILQALNDESTGPGGRGDLK